MPLGGAKGRGLGPRPRGDGETVGGEWLLLCQGALTCPVKVFVDSFVEYRPIYNAFKSGFSKAVKSSSKSSTDGRLQAFCKSIFNH